MLTHYDPTKCFVDANDSIPPRVCTNPRSQPNEFALCVAGDKVEASLSMLIATGPARQVNYESIAGNFICAARMDRALQVQASAELNPSTFSIFKVIRLKTVIFLVLLTVPRAV